jgi:hypothetical protein
MGQKTSKAASGPTAKNTTEHMGKTFARSGIPGVAGAVPADLRALRVQRTLRPSLSRSWPRMLGASGTHRAANKTRIPVSGYPHIGR